MSPASGLHIGYRRARQPEPPPVVISIDRAVEVEIGRLIADEAKLVDGDCPQSPMGHYAIRSAGDFVCAHCSRVFWR